jgi:hypothetical protein
MSDLFSAIEVSPLEIEKITKHLEKIRQSQGDDSDLMTAVSAAIDEFNKFFLNYGKPYFPADKLLRNETAQSSKYNGNFEALTEDLDRLYTMVESAAETSLAAFNFATVTAKEINESSAIAASKVLDLNIIKNFVKGRVIVAGDDFLNGDKVDFTIGVDTTQADILKGSSAMSLTITDAEIITNEDTSISITPFLPIGDSDAVNTEPTPGNLKRFYEGQYYAPIGEMRPAGGSLSLEYIADPSTLEIGTTEETVDGKVGLPTEESEEKVGFFAIVPPDEDRLKLARKKMLDGNPSTFWECEFVYEVPDLIEPFNT